MLHCVRRKCALPPGVPGTLQPGQAIRFPCSLSIFAFISSIRLGSCVSAGMERYLREVVGLLKQRAFSGQEAQSSGRAWYTSWVRLRLVSLLGMAAQLFALRTEIHPAWIERKIRSGEETWFGVRSLETLLPGKARIPFSELDVGDISIALFIPAQSQAVE
jgi:hypothetical protein